jgi:hypothetical protein
MVHKTKIAPTGFAHKLNIMPTCKTWLSHRSEMLIGRRLFVTLLCLSVVSCTSLQFGESLPFEAGRTKEEKPYDEGLWIGPVALDAAEKEIIAASDGRKNRMGWLFYDTGVEWKKLKAMMRAGDEIWSFGFSLVRDKKIVACVITNVFE